jgi:hypothetical protein
MGENAIVAGGRRKRDSINPSDHIRTVTLTNSLLTIVIHTGDNCDVKWRAKLIKLHGRCEIDAGNSVPGRIRDRKES